MAAETAVVLAFARPGTTIALAEGAYFGTSVLFRSLEHWGLRFVEYDQTGPPPADADIVWVESPANPMLTVPDWDALRAHGGLIVCDATVATPVYLRALDEGADVVVHSATKFLTGNHDALLGATVSRDPEQAPTPPRRRGRDGHRLLAALGRLAARAGSTRSRAGCAGSPRRRPRSPRRLDEHPAVELVRYPGYSGLISFDVADPRAVETRTRLIMNATSLGGVNSTMESRHRWEGDRIPRGAAAALGRARGRRRALGGSRAGARAR